MKTLLLSCCILFISANCYCQQLETPRTFRFDTNYVKHYFKNLQKQPPLKFWNHTNITHHGDVAMINMPKPVLLFENEQGKAYQQPADKMKYLAPYNRSNMPVKK